MMVNGAVPRLSRGSGYRSFGLQGIGAAAVAGVVGLRMTSWGVASEESIATPSFAEVE